MNAERTPEEIAREALDAWPRGLAPLRISVEDRDTLLRIMADAIRRGVEQHIATRDAEMERLRREVASLEAEIIDAREMAEVEG